MFRIILASALLATLAGCASFDSTSISYRTVDPDGNNKGASRVFLWKSTYSAGIGTDEGSCVQPATTLANLNLSSSLEAKDSAGQILIGGADLSRTVEAINASSVATTFNADSLFYLCQMDLNRAGSDKRFSTSELFKLMGVLWQRTVELKDAAGTRASPNAPAVVASLLSAIDKARAEGREATQEELEEAVEQADGAVSATEEEQ